MSYNTLLFEENDGIGVLKINRPESLNALNREVLTELDSFLDQVQSSESLRCLVVTGSGEKAFVAGADIKEMTDLSSEAANEFARKGQSVFSRFEDLNVPVIAAVNGFALGGGLELALSCDFIIASNKARFGLPEVTLGLLPGFGGTQRLSQAVGLRKAREMTFTGKHYDATAALEMRLVNQVVEPETLMDAVAGITKSFARTGPVAVALSKKSINKGYDLDRDQGLELEAELFGELFATADAREGTQAFVEKRAANFTGK